MCYGKVLLGAYSAYVTSCRKHFGPVPTTSMMDDLGQFDAAITQQDMSEDDHGSRIGSESPSGDGAPEKFDAPSSTDHDAPFDQQPSQTSQHPQILGAGELDGRETFYDGLDSGTSSGFLPGSSVGALPRRDSSEWDIPITLPANEAIDVANIPLPPSPIASDTDFPLGFSPSQWHTHLHLSTTGSPPPTSPPSSSRSSGPPSSLLNGSRPPTPPLVPLVSAQSVWEFPPGFIPNDPSVFRVNDHSLLRQTYCEYPLYLSISFSNIHSLIIAYASPTEPWVTNPWTTRPPTRISSQTSVPSPSSPTPTDDALNAAHYNAFQDLGPPTWGRGDPLDGDEYLPGTLYQPQYIPREFMHPIPIRPKPPRPSLSTEFQQYGGTDYGTPYASLGSPTSDYIPTPGSYFLPPRPLPLQHAAHLQPDYPPWATELGSRPVSPGPWITPGPFDPDIPPESPGSWFPPRPSFGDVGPTPYIPPLYSDFGDASGSEWAGSASRIPQIMVQPPSSEFSSTRYTTPGLTEDDQYPEGPISVFDDAPRSSPFTPGSTPWVPPPGFIPRTFEPAPLTPGSYSYPPDDGYAGSGKQIESITLIPEN